jgi:hypothetical protein
MRALAAAAASSSKLWQAATSPAAARGTRPRTTASTGSVSEERTEP